ncbi:MAG TPA: TonB-dependent receptor plug domain-containing protein [Mucilaginibacter sp.]|jgi:TonB-dependent SusC/RagA subfamily outer membrane receptor|nr:TonB-dependent receptor plug domain-containing protein [Mucilaginibacter sp.]
MKPQQTVIARNEVHRICGGGVMLRYSKHEGKGLIAPILREPQDDSALLDAPTVIARNEAISELRQSRNRINIQGRCGLLLSLVFCLFMSLNAWSQVQDTLNKETSRKKNGVISPAKALIVVDGVIYNGDLKNINPDDISNVAVLKNPGATNIYGPQGSNGVIVIQTKHYKPPTYKSQPLDSVVEKDALFVIDGVPSKNKLNDVDAKNVLSIDILKKGKNSDLSFEPVRDVVIVVTKTGAIKAYQKKFSAFSQKYKDYLNKRNGNDSSLLYVVNGVPVQGKRDDITRTLYKVPAEKIKAVGFNQGKIDIEYDTAAVIINLK